MSTKAAYNQALKDELNPDRYTADETTRTVRHNFYWNAGLSIYIEIHDREDHGVCFAHAFFNEQRVTGNGLLYFGGDKDGCIAAMKAVRDTYIHA